MTRFGFKRQQALMMTNRSFPSTQPTENPRTSTPATTFSPNKTCCMGLSHYLSLIMA
jgi:hypothetical protein